MNRRNRNRDYSRRNFLKVAGAGAISTATVPALSQAKRDSDEILNKSLELREKNNWSPSKWRKYLRKKGFATAHSKKTYVREKSTSDDIGTQKFEQDKLTLDCSLIECGPDSDYDIWAESHFDVEDGWLRDGEIPDDAVGFGWDGDEYDFRGDDTSGWYCSNYDAVNVGTYSGKNCGFKFKDDGNAKDGNHIGVKLLIEGGTKSTRNVIFSYMHTYNDATLQSVKFGTDGVVVANIEPSTEKWNVPVQDQIFEDNAESQA